MAILENEPRPSGQAEHYRFLRDSETGAVFKAKQEARTALNGNPALAVSIAPVDEDGKALRDPNGAPDLYHWTHTFTADELADPTFDLDARVSAMLHAAIAAKQAELSLRQSLSALGSMWASADPLTLPRPAADLPTKAFTMEKTT